jgi:hypothetical protein
MTMTTQGKTESVTLNQGNKDRFLANINKLLAEGKTEAVERKPREWWLQVDSYGKVHSYHLHECDALACIREGKGCLHTVVHVVEMLEKTDGN